MIKKLLNYEPSNEAFATLLVAIIILTIAILN